jgi:hypothetical protein
MSMLSRRQRTAPPIDRWHARRLEAAGGVDVASPRTLAPGIDNELMRYPGTVFDGRITRDRGPYYQHPTYVPPANNWVNWTAAGPPRPELHVRNATLRTMVGNTESRYPVTDSFSTGRHTMVEPGVSRTVQRYVHTPQMTGARINRLRPGQYAGQTYSQATQIQGG